MTQEKNRGFKGIWIPRELWLREDLNLLEKAVIAEIDSLDQDEGCTASDAYLAEFFGCSKGHLSDTLSGLRGRGLIETIKFDGRRRLLRQVAFRCESDPKAALLKTIEQPSEISEPPLIRDNKEDIPLQPPAVEKVKPPEPIMRSIIDFLMTLDGIKFTEQRGSDWGRIRKLAKDIFASTPDVTIEEVMRRAENYRKKWPKASLTAAALVKWWPSLGEVEKKYTGPASTLVIR